MNGSLTYVHRPGLYFQAEAARLAKTLVLPLLVGVIVGWVLFFLYLADDPKVATSVVVTMLVCLAVSTKILYNWVRAVLAAPRYFRDIKQLHLSATGLRLQNTEDRYAEFGLMSIAAIVEWTTRHEIRFVAIPTLVLARTPENDAFMKLLLQAFLARRESSQPVP